MVVDEVNQIKITPSVAWQQTGLCLQSETLAMQGFIF